MTSTFVTRPTVLSCVLIAFAVVACGGTYVSSDSDGSDDGATGGSQSGAGGSQNGTGGRSATGGTGPGSGGASGSGAQTGTGGEPPQCCLAEAVCNDYDTQIESEADCPIGAECYSNTACCSTVWCMEEQAACDAIPVCLEGETEVPECPEDASCVKRALCGTVIVCQQGALECDHEANVHLHYVGDSPQECQVIDYSCPEYTTGFSNGCGCGCEQPSSCPEFLDCEPGGSVDPLCNSEECPYTPRAF